MKVGPLPLAALCCCLFTIQTVRAAQSAEQDKASASASAASTSAEKPVALETIVVEGKRETDIAPPRATIGVLGDLPLMEAPYTVSVIGERLLEIQQATRYTDYLKNVPGSNVGNVAIGFFSLRGFPVGTDGYLYDGLPGHQGLSELYQIDGFESIEVFKGPAAFLSGLGGSTSLGGTLNYTPKRATAEPVRAVETDYANRSLWSVGTDLGQRFGSEQQFGLRLNARYRDGEQSAKRYDWTQKAAALAMDWRASSTLKFAANLEYADNHLPSLPPFYFVFPGVRVPDAPNASRTVAQPWDEFASTGRTAYVRGDWTFMPEWTLTAQAQSSQTERPQEKGARSGAIVDDDGNVSMGAFEERSRLKGNSGQLLLRGKTRTGFLDHQLTAGYTALAGRDYGGFESLATIPTNLYDPVDAPEPAGLPVPLELTGKSHGTSYLVSDVIGLGERWSVLAAARRASFITTGSDEVEKTSPTAALMFKPVPGSLLYVNYAQGLEQGGTAEISGNVINSGEQLKAVVTEQVELGGKLEHRGVTYSVAVFQLERPLETNVPVDDENVEFRQDGDQRHRGVEIAAVGNATPDLAIYTGAAFIDPKAHGTSDPETNGKRPPSVPRVTVNLFADYRIGVIPGVFVNAGAYHNAKQFLDGANTQKLESWTRYDIGARYETAFRGAGAQFLLGVGNLLDDDYWVGQNGILTLADPLTVKLSARFEL